MVSYAIAQKKFAIKRAHPTGSIFPLISEKAINIPNQMQYPKLLVETKIA